MDYEIETAMAIIAQLEYERRVAVSTANAMIRAKDQQLAEQAEEISELKEALGIKKQSEEESEAGKT